MSNQFDTVNGVKQGGVLSSLLLAVNIDGLLNSLEETSAGYHIGIHLIRILSFADNINLLTSTLSGLRIVIDVC